MTDGALTFGLATESDAPALARLRTAVGERLGERYGPGLWAAMVTERGVLFGLKHARVLVARSGGRIVGTLRLVTKKPWAIDPSYFTAVERPLYLTDMAVAPAEQGRGIGRALLEEAERLAREWPSQAIRLDAWDADAGAGGFYAKCGYRERGRVTYRGNPLIYYERLL
jgi:GNAT superfamily N-acetyltransferase